MKLFFIIFSAILAAVAVVAGVYSYNARAERERAAFVSLAESEVKILETASRSLRINDEPTAADVTRFRDYVRSAKGTLALRKFPRHLKPQIEDAIKESVAEVRAHIVVTKNPTDLLAIIDGL